MTSTFIQHPFLVCQPNFDRLSTTLQISQTLGTYSVWALQVADFSNLYPPIRIRGVNLFSRHDNRLITADYRSGVARAIGYQAIMP